MTVRTNFVTSISAILSLLLIVLIGWYLLHLPQPGVSRLHAITSYPLLLPAGEKSTRVNFKVYLAPGDAAQPASVLLQQAGGRSHALNDAGRGGDFYPGDHVYGAVVELDSGNLAAGQCLQFTAVAEGEAGSFASPPYEICATGFPPRVAVSGFGDDNRVELDDDGLALGDELLLRFEPGTSEARIAEVAAAFEAEVVGQLPSARMHQFRFAASRDADALLELAARIARRREVESVSPNLLVLNSAAPSDPEYMAGNQHGLQKIFTDPLSSRTLWDVPGTSGGSTVFVLDSGVDFTHQDLSGIDLHCVQFDEPAAAIGPCAAGDEDANTGNNGHGMRVIAVIAAERDNAAGIAGVVAASPVVSVRSVNAASQAENDAGMDTIAGAIESLAAVAFLPASNPTVVNFSRNLGGGAALPAVQAFCGAVNNVVNGGGTPGLGRPAILVNSAGNNNSNLGSGSPFAWPVQCKISSSDASNASSYFDDVNNDLLIVVGNSVSCAGGAPSCADGSDDTRYSGATGSNFGSLVDLFAPGTGTVTPDTTGTAGYSAITGTSFAAPLVAGAAALMLDCGVPVGDINSTLKSFTGVIIDGAPRINLFASMRQFTESVHGPLAVASSYSLGSANLPQGTAAGTAVAGLALANPLGSCNQVSYSIDNANFAIAGSNVVIAPGATLLSGTTEATTVTAVDAYGRSATVDIDFDVVADPPSAADIDAVLVLDRSGSMSGGSATGGIDKLTAMQTAAEQFVAYLAGYEQHRLGLVQFNSAVVPFAPADEFPFQLLDSGNQADAVDAIASVAAGGSTNIIAGIAAGAALVNTAPATPRKVLVLFTDGKHNSPSTLGSAALAGDLATEIDNVDPGIDVYSIGFGTSIDDAALIQLTGSHGGWHLNEQDLDPMSLGKTFTDVAADVAGDAAIYDPVFYLGAGDSETLAVPVSVNDENLTFVIRWEAADPERVRTVIRPPLGGCDIGPPGPGGEVYQAAGDNYRLLRVELPFPCGERKVHGGTWKVVVSAGKKVEREERVLVNTYTRTRARLEAGLATGDRQIEFSAAFGAAGAIDFRRVEIAAGIRLPLPDSQDSTAQDNSGGSATPPPAEGYRGFIPVKLVPDREDPTRWRGSFRQLAGDGVYQARFTATALDQNGQQIRREIMRSIYYQAAGKDRWTWPVMIVGGFILLWYLLRLFRRKS